MCSPSRASILTGLYAHAHGVLDNFTEYPEELPTWPKALRAAGYTTAYIGKYHMGEENDDVRGGFDYFVTHRGQGKYYDSEFRFHGGPRRVVPGYYTTVVTDMALEWLRRPKGGKPWALILGHKAAHSFYYPEPKFAHAFDHVNVPYPASAFQIADNDAWYASGWIRGTASTGRFRLPQELARPLARRCPGFRRHDPGLLGHYPFSR